MLTRRTVLAGLALAVTPLTASAQQSELIAADYAQQRAAGGDLLIVDVRTPGEWSKTGIPEGAHAIAMQDPALAEKLDALTGGNRDRPVALICATGVRSGRVASAMARAGYTNVYSIGEGMHGSASGPGWLRRGLPVAKAPCVTDC